MVSGISMTVIVSCRGISSLYLQARLDPELGPYVYRGSLSNLDGNADEFEREILLVHQSTHTRDDDSGSFFTAFSLATGLARYSNIRDSPRQAAPHADARCRGQAHLSSRAFARCL